MSRHSEGKLVNCLVCFPLSLLFPLHPAFFLIAGPAHQRQPYCEMLGQTPIMLTAPPTSPWPSIFLPHLCYLTCMALSCSPASEDWLSVSFSNSPPLPTKLSLLYHIPQLLIRVNPLIHNAQTGSASLTHPWFHHSVCCLGFHYLLLSFLLWFTLCSFKQWHPFSSCDKKENLLAYNLVVFWLIFFMITFMVNK